MRCFGLISCGIGIFILCVISGCVQSFLSGGWHSIMPGPNLEGWTVVDVPADGPLSRVPQWSMDAKAGVLRCSGKGGRDWLRCDQKEFSDFVFHVEWRFIKLADSDAKYNSGVFVRNASGWSVWHQAQLGSGTGGYLFGNTIVNGEPARFTTRDQISENPVRPAGEWNTFDIACRGSRISLAVNGVPTTVWDHCEVRKGYVGLEAENFMVEFRNLIIKEY